jgi:hypothetical protein
VPQPAESRVRYYSACGSAPVSLGPLDPCIVLIHTLYVVQYSTPRGPWSGNLIRDPSWEQTEFFLRRLDRCLFPFVWLYRSGTADPKDHVPDFEVLGGSGEYSLVSGRVTFVDLARGSSEVNIWVSDQGASFPKFQLCPDLELAVSAVRFFCETGELLPSAQWLEM